MLPISRSISGTLLLLGALALPATTHAQQFPAPQVGQLLVPDGGASTDSRISPLLGRAKGRVNVWVQLQTSPLAVEQANAKDSGLPLTSGAQRAHLARLED